MSRESKAEKLETKGYLLGISEGLHQAAKWLEHESGKAFMAHNDKTAELMRRASGEIAAKASEARALYDKEYPQ